MSKPSWIVVLCEDSATAGLLRGYLNQCGIGNRSMRLVVNPKGRGAGDSFVLCNFAQQVDAYRISKARKRTWLLAAIDADGNTVAARLDQLSMRLRSAKEPRLREMRMEKERIALLVPKRNIETWLRVLTGANGDEETDFKHTMSSREWQELIDPAVRTLFQWTRPNHPAPDRCLPSLKLGVQELRKLSQ